MAIPPWILRLSDRFYSSYVIKQPVIPADYEGKVNVVWNNALGHYRGVGKQRHLLQKIFPQGHRRKKAREVQHLAFKPDIKGIYDSFLPGVLGTYPLACRSWDFLIMLSTREGRSLDTTRPGR